MDTDQNDTPDTLPVELVPIDQLTTHPENPRRGDVAAIRSRLQRYGQYSPLVAQRSTGHILVGNHRHLAARELGWTHVNVHWLDVSDEQARRILLDDNRTTDKAAYDDRALAELLATLEPVGDTLDDTLWGPDDLTDLETLLAGLDAVDGWNDSDGGQSSDGAGDDDLIGRTDLEDGRRTIAVTITADHYNEFYGLLGDLPYVVEVNDKAKGPNE